MDQCSLLQQHQTKNGIVTRSHAAIGSKKPTTIIEVLVVSDGSTDDTAGVVRRFQAQQQTKKDGIVIRLLELSRNSGKGAAVQAGMLRTRGNVCLMADADGATDFGPGITAVLKTYKELSEKQIRHIVVFGSRAHLEKASTATRSPLRSILMVCFHWFVAHLCDNTSIRDTQCGFKLFSRPAAMALFTNLHLQRWAFDTELIVIVGKLTNTDCPFELTEVSVPWHEVDGSKLDTSKFALAWNSITMLRDMICVRACYYLGIWKLKP
jgi:dolichyl-phosphate beta-glucosyltransferase